MRKVSAMSRTYDDAVDNMFFKLGESSATDEDEVLPGIHVLYSWNGKREPNVVGVEIEYFKERFSGKDAIEIPASSPFVLSIS